MSDLKNESRVAEFLADAALQLAQADDLDLTVTAYREAGVLTEDAGFVLRVGNPGGAEYQVTIIRSN